MRNLILIGAMAIASVLSAMAQTAVVTSVTTAEWPTIQATVYGISAAGALENVTANDLAITQNGLVVTPTVECPSGSTPRNVSLVMMFDRSGSASPSSLAIQKAAATAAERVAGSTLDEIGVLSFDQRVFMHMGLSADRTLFTTALADITAGNGSNVRIALDSAPMGGLPQSLGGLRNRTLLLMIDGASQIDAARLRTLMRGFRTTLYLLCLDGSLSEQLRELADSTGGAWVENVSTEAEAVSAARALVAHAKRINGCVVRWTTNDPCTRAQNVEFARGTSTVRRPIRLPLGSRIVLEPSTSSLFFGNVEPGQSATQDVIITARNGPAVVSAVRSSNPAYRITPSIPAPFVIQDGGSFTFTIRYTAPDSNSQFTRITIETMGVCDSTIVFARAGFPQRPSELRLVQPNGGETFLAGLDTVITWTGILPSDNVRIQISSDNGQTWRSITESASGLTYPWSPGPETGSSMLIRLQQTVLDQSRVLRLEGHSGPIYGATFTPDGSSIITVSHDRTARIWDATTGALQRTLIGHGDWVWCVATHPVEPIVATGSYDGDVRLWNYQTGDMLGVVPMPQRQRVESIDFSRDGAVVAVGTETGIKIIDMATRTLSSTESSTTSAVSALRYSPDGTLMATGEGLAINIRNASNLQVIRTLPGHTGAVYGLDFTPDGGTLISGGADLRLRSWNVNTGDVRVVGDSASASWHAIDVSTAGGQFVASNGDGTVRLFEVSSLRQLNTVAGGLGIVYAATFSANSRRVVAGGTGFVARVVDVDGLSLAEDGSDGVFTITGSTANAVSVNAGPVRVGDGIDVRATVLRNTGNRPIIINDIRSTGSDFSIPPFSGTRSLNAGDSLVLKVVFAPRNVGSSSGTVEVVTGIGTFSAPLQGTGIAQPLAGPSLVNFGRRIAGTDQIDTIVTVRNPVGSSTIVVLRQSIAGSASSAFSLPDGTASFTLPANGTRQIRVRFTPTQNARYAGRLVFDFDGPEDQSIFLYGEGSGNAQIATSAAIIFETSPCSTETSSRNLTISNQGNTQLSVYDVITQVPDATEFSILRGGAPFTPPVILQPSEQLQLTIQFRPKTGGIKTGSLVVISDAVNATGGATFVSIVARKDSVGFSLSQNEVNFGNVSRDSSATRTIQLVNTGSLTLRWPRQAVSVGPFIVERVTPDITPAGGRSDIVVRFVGGVVGQTYSESFTFRDSICGTTQSLSMVATVKDVIGFVVRPDSVRTTTGTTVRVPVYVSNRLNLDRTSVRDFQATFEVNGTLLTPTGSTPQGTLENNGRTRRFSVTIPIPTTQDSLATTLEFQTTWGNDSASAISIVDIVVNDTLEITPRQGRVVLTDLCREGGVRLIQETAASVALVVAPQPSYGTALLHVGMAEHSPISIVISDVSGRAIRTITERTVPPGEYTIPLDLSALASGTYRIVLTTKSDVVTTRFDVSK
ncbi:MAG: choice-of-anchor D domain-containing protein [Candidatus Kapabacteria bacterium]|nr:choice-of-anchor D domain-containing protein [Candidatus Kapabacteria bacterium]